MKTLKSLAILLALAGIPLSAAYSDSTSVVANCLTQINAYTYPTLGVACKGVKTSSDVSAVKDCLNRVNAYTYSSTSFGVACRGVKTASDVGAVINCLSKVNAYTYSDVASACEGAN